MGAYTEIVDFTFTANETSRTFSGLSITKDDFIKVILSAVPNTTNVAYALFPNSNTTTTNFTRQFLDGNGSSVSAGRNNVNRFAFAGTGVPMTSIGYIKISENNKYNMFFNNTRNNDSDIAVNYFYTTEVTGTTSSITSLTLEASATNAIGTGSRIQIYRLDAVKVADFVTTSNSTQVDIPFPTGTFNPAIDKDSEYLLVSDVIETVFNLSINLFPNGLTTATGYHSQRIFGIGSTAGASRINNARYMSGEDIDKRSLAHTHIKLSNIGAFTAQSYQIRKYGESTVDLLNMFVSSTAENITSITELNIVASGTNGIKAGSRFTLYKLYE